MKLKTPLLSGLLVKETFTGANCYAEEPRLLHKFVYGEMEDTPIEFKGWVPGCLTLNTDNFFGLRPRINRKGLL